MNKLEVDSKQVINLFADLTGKQQKQAHKAALRKSSSILVKETKKQLRKVIGKAINHKNKWNGKTLGSGIKTSVDKKGESAKVHLLGDFRLKFFEMGTEKRHIKKNKANRGKIKPSYYFKQAKANKEREIFNSIDQLLTQSIVKIANKYKK